MQPRHLLLIILSLVLTATRALAATFKERSDSMKSLRLFFELFTLARTKPVVVIVAVLVANLVGLEGAAKGQETLETVIPDFEVTCTSAGQLCEPPFTIPVETRSLLQVQYAVRSVHCSSVRLHIFVDEVLVQTTDFLGWPGAGAPFDGLPLETELLELGPVSPGPHVLALQAEGQVSGCNTGYVSNWGGSLRVVTAPFFTAAASSGAPVPGGSGVFTVFPQSPAVSVGSVAFLGVGSAGEAGVYLSPIGEVGVPPNPVKVADLATAIPSGNGTFTSFSNLALAVDVSQPNPPPIHTAFIGSGDNQQGVYLSDVTDVSTPTPPPIKVADLLTDIPDGTGTFTSFSDLALAVDVSSPTPPPIHTAFIGSGVGQQGVYLSEITDVAVPPNPIKVADLLTAIPGGMGTFTSFSDLALAVDVSIPTPPPIHTAFIGSGVDQQGVYLSEVTDVAFPLPPPIKVADLLTAIPGGTGTFTSFSDLALAVDVSQPVPPPIHTAFIGSGVGQQGVYLSEVTDVATPQPPPIKVADLTTAIPGGTGNFTGFSAVSTSLGHTVFLGLGSGGQAGIYLASTLKKVIAVGDTLDGKVIAALRLGRSGLDGIRLTFTATFADGSEGVFVAQVGLYPFTGFFPPVDNPPAMNVAKAGSAIPVKFSLNGNQGLDIFADGYPKSQAIACDSASPPDGIEETVTAGSSSLSYDATTDQYKYVWKTDKAWAGSCRQFVVKLIDGSSHVADFKFTK